MSNLSFKFSCWIATCLLACACSGKNPDAAEGKNSESSGGSKASSSKARSGGGDSSVHSAGKSSSEAEPAGNVDVGEIGKKNCKTSCSPGDCGPISDDCGGIIECGGCEAPDTCGGAGIPSRCGSPLSYCVPKTCEDFHVTCGFQGNGCGGLLNCWNEAAKATGATPSCEKPGDLCIEGNCKSPAPECTKRNCDFYAGTPDLCGPLSDGCGGTLDCGRNCSSDKVCGAVEPGKCGTVTCVPMGCEAALRLKPAGYCGVVPDGCGGILAECAGGCAVAGETCGGGGTPDVCGRGAPECVPRTSAACGNQCGPMSDGCGGTLQCDDCKLPATCGGGGIPSQCGAPACQPRSCASVGATCGAIADGCGGTLNCGSCSGTDTCGGGGTPNKCGGAICVPKTQSQLCLPGRCGPQSDGCGGAVDCGGCSNGNTCGGGGTPSVCGAPACTKRTCASAGANCGPISDGCGGIIPSCGNCSGSDVCGAVYPSVCGAGLDPHCTGLCQKVDRTCNTGSETRLTGKVYAPNGTDPLYNALVYVPNAALPQIKTGPSCDRCEDEDLGKPIAAAITGPDGAFVLRNVPAGVDFPLVVKIGKWRRVVTIPAVTRCTNVNLTADQSRLPKSMSDATAVNRAYVNIPHFAIVTGSVDGIECVLRKMGVDDGEFTSFTGGGRIHIYRGNGGYIGSSTTGLSADLFALQGSQARLYNYDIGVIDCDGNGTEHNSDDPTIRAWANAGGRLFLSHYGYTYLHDNGDFANSAQWAATHTGATADTGIVDTTTPKGSAFNTWLGNVGAFSPIYGRGYIDITQARYDAVRVNAGSEQLLYTSTLAVVNSTRINATDSAQQFSFNTPYGADAAHVCGRVLFSAFHVANVSNSGEFPRYCTAGAMTAQEKVLMFSLFDLSACVTVDGPSTPATCTPKTCAEMSATCGQVADGCGGLLSCGDCTPPLSCGGGGVPNQCGNSCTRTTCGAQGATCGVIADGCGGTLSCGSCDLPAVCGGGGTPNVCGTPACSPRSCSDIGATCGAISDGCGGTLDCGTCKEPESCGGGGTPNVCGIGTCTPQTCGTAECGFVGDGCGGTIACGTCTEEETCVSGTCVGTACTKRSCEEAHAKCGYVGDGCGGVVSCGTCLPPLVCGGGGVPSECGGNCKPVACGDVNAECGAISDGCGGVKECGVCPPGQSCGGGGVPNRCAAGTCVPRNCTAANAECGAIGDGCGGVLDCGDCADPMTCGGGGIANRCGAGGCQKLTCEAQHANCGPVADGCGGLLDCGPCPVGQTCGGGGVPSQCGGGMAL